MNNESNWSDFYSQYRYIPNREKKSKEYSGVIDLEDFSTSSPTRYTVMKIVNAMHFNKSLKRYKMKEIKKK